MLSSIVLLPAFCGYLVYLTLHSEIRVSTRKEKLGDNMHNYSTTREPALGVKPTIMHITGLRHLTSPTETAISPSIPA